jgi:uncharacterized protein (TIGR02145 family)
MYNLNKKYKSQEKHRSQTCASTVLFILLATLSFPVFAQDAKTFDEGVTINGVKWATRNVATPGTFADKPEDLGMFYQWNRRRAWAATGGVSRWNDTIPEGNKWIKDNDPCPVGWRIPTLQELQKLVDSGSEWKVAKVNGRIFGNDSITIFLPAAGIRSDDNGTLEYAGLYGNYWSSTQLGMNETNAYALVFHSEFVFPVNYWYKVYGLSCRCVAEEVPAVSEP